MGRTADRGYGTEHLRVRARWKPMVDRGEVNCARCGLYIPAGGEGRCPSIRPNGKVCGKNHKTWHLGHDDHDRTVWTGPEHLCCNVRTPNILKAQARTRHSRRW